jgi:hypothetical protein
MLMAEPIKLGIFSAAVLLFFSEKVPPFFSFTPTFDVTGVVDLIPFFCGYLVKEIRRIGFGSFFWALQFYPGS